jgi:RNA polymerase sigma-70 factor, ECF subfamily
MGGEMDVDLVVRARAGDHDAFAELARGSIGRLTAAARLILHDEYRAQDAVQDCLVDAWRDIRGLRDPERFDAWLHRLLVHACHDRARRDRRRGLVEIELDRSGASVEQVVGPSVETRDSLERALRRLSHDHRMVLVLTYYLDLPQADAAQALGIPYGTMKSRLNRATHALRAALEADEREPSGALGRYA